MTDFLKLVFLTIWKLIKFAVIGFFMILAIACYIVAGKKD